MRGGEEGERGGGRREEEKVSRETRKEKGNILSSYDIQTVTNDAGLVHLHQLFNS